jgi:DNA-directed RNA polymerase specialized sigma24 family protein
MRRGLPRPDAEDLVQRAWEKSVAAHDTSKGSLEALMTRVVQRDAVDWWRRQMRHSAAHEQLKLTVVDSGDSGARQIAAKNQRTLLDALDAEERRVFGVWALQKHLPQGSFPAPRAARTLGMTVPEYENAKRRLRSKVRHVLDELGWTPHDLYSAGDDEGPRRKHVSNG